MFLFTNGVAQYSADIHLPNQVEITRTVFTCAEHPEQNVALRHYLTYSGKVHEISSESDEDMLVITLDDDLKDSYSLYEIKAMFVGDGEKDPVIYCTESDRPFRDDEPVCCGNDPVNHPNHYKTSSGLEAIDVIDAFTEDLKGYECTYTSQVLKYTLRWKHKNGLEDLEKANWYLTRLINKLKKTQK